MSSEKNKEPRESDWELRRKMGALYGDTPVLPAASPVNAINAAGIPGYLGAPPSDMIYGSLTRGVYGPASLAGPFANVASASEMTGAIPASPSPAPFWDNSIGMPQNSEER